MTASSDDRKVGGIELALESMTVQRIRKLAALIANDVRTRKPCMRAGERRLAVPAASETAFRRALRDAGFLLATGPSRPPKLKKASAETAPE